MSEKYKTGLFFVPVIGANRLEKKRLDFSKLRRVHIQPNKVDWLGLEEDSPNTLVVKELCFSCGWACYIGTGDDHKRYVSFPAFRVPKGFSRPVLRANGFRAGTWYWRRNQESKK